MSKLSTTLNVIKIYNYVTNTRKYILRHYFYTWSKRDMVITLQKMQIVLRSSCRGNLAAIGETWTLLETRHIWPPLVLLQMSHCLMDDILQGRGFNILFLYFTVNSMLTVSMVLWKLCLCSHLQITNKPTMLFINNYLRRIKTVDTAVHGPDHVCATNFKRMSLNVQTTWT